MSHRHGTGVRGPALCVYRPRGSRRAVGLFVVSGNCLVPELVSNIECCFDGFKGQERRQSISLDSSASEQRK